MRNSIEEIFAKEFPDESSIFNPFVTNSRYKEVIADYRSFNNLQDTMDYFKLSEKQVKALLGLNGNMPEIYLSILCETDCLNLENSNHTVQNTLYRLEDFVIIPKSDYKAIMNLAENQPANQLPFSQLLYSFTQVLKTRDSNYKTNYRILSLLMTPELLQSKQQVVIHSTIPTIFYHVYKSKNDKLEIFRFYDKSLKVYQQFSFKKGDFDIK